MSDVVFVSERELNELVEVCDYVEWIRDVVGYMSVVCVGCKMRVGDYMVYGIRLGDENWRLVKKMMY
jgi:hypothetical protein